jgi:hypothetical protein
MTVVGPFHPPEGLKQHYGTYIGEGKLQGEEAVVFIVGEDAYAQFNNKDTGCGFGWWLFSASDFKLDPVSVETDEPIPIESSLDRTKRILEEVGVTVLTPEALDDREAFEEACAKSLLRSPLDD